MNPLFLKWQRKSNLSKPRSDRGVYGRIATGDSGKAGGYQRIDGARDVIGEEQADLILGTPEGVITAANRFLEDFMLERVIAPTPLKAGTDRMVPVKLQRVLIRLRRRIGRHVRILPIRAPGEQPHGPVVGARIALGNETGSGAGIVAPALHEALHLFEVLEDGVALGGQVRAAGDVERELLEPVRLADGFTVELREPRNEIHLRGEIHGAAILVREQLPRSGHQQG